MMDLSIIVISFNTKKLTKDAVESVIVNTKGLVYEIIVVENGSRDGSPEVLQKLASKHKTITLILNKMNLGFGQGNNQGMRIAKGRYILLLNSDTLVKNNVLREMVSYMDDNPKVGIATCSLRFENGGVQGTGGYFPTLGRVFAWMSFLDDTPLLDRIIKPYHPYHSLSPLGKNEAFFKSKKEVDWITGAFFLMRREVMKKVGYFDEEYFMYVEEVDFCYRAKNLGWQIWYLPKWNIIHYGGASSTSEFPIMNEVKSLKTFYKKHMPEWQNLALRLLIKWGAFLRALVFGILKGKEAARVYGKIFVTA